MKSILVYLIAFVAITSVTRITATSLDDVSEKVKKFVILMLENRSFDHALGFLKKQNEEIDGCIPEQAGCSNMADPHDETSASSTVGDQAMNVVANPHHSIKETTLQIYGYYDPVPEGTAASMDGFALSYANVAEDPLSIMQCFAPEHVPILSTLANEFAVFDGFHASVPGPTMVNRAYAFSATSHGMGTNDYNVIFRGLPQKSLFKQVLDMGLDYGVYFSDGPTSIEMKDMRSREGLKKFHFIEKLYDDIEAGSLPDVTWVDPAYYNGERHKATDQHPDHDVSLGEQLIKDVYESLRASSLWNETALIITYDEHGGFFDHVVPPENVPNPDGLNSTDDPFDFTRLGVRIPTILVSPWVQKGTVVHATNPTNDPDSPPGTGSYEHSSVISTMLHKILKPKEGGEAPEYLTKRDYWAATFEHVFDNSLTEPRSDCLTTLPEVWNGSTSVIETDGKRRMSDLQIEILVAVAGAREDHNVLDMVIKGRLQDTWTEGEGLEYCREAMQTLMDRASL